METALYERYNNQPVPTEIYLTIAMNTEAIQYDARQAMQIAASIARPRRVGSQAETQVGRDLANRLKQAGYQVQAEPFRFTDVHSVFLLLEIIVCQVLVAVTMWLHAAGSPIQIMTAVLLFLLLGLVNGINRAVQAGSLVVEGFRPTTWARMCQRLGRSYQSTNYVARISDSPVEMSLPHLILVAHYDSKSQRIPLAVRITLFVVSIGGALLFAGLILLSPLMPELTTPALILGGLMLAASVSLWFLDLGDDSPGAIDNASSVGVVVELAQALAKNQEIYRKIDLTILLTSAEEVSTMGAIAYVHRHEKDLLNWAKSNRMYVLNLEGVGVDGSLRWVGKGEQASLASEPCLLRLVRQACIEQGCEIRNFNLPGALYDHLPFAALGLDAGTLMAVNRASLGVHTRRDSADQLDLRGFERAGQITLKVIQALLSPGNIF